MIPQDRCVKHRSITEIDSHRSHRLVMCEQNPCRPDRDNARAILHIVNIASFYSPSLLKRNQPWKGCEGPNMKEKEIQVVSVRGVNCNFIFHSFFTISSPHVKESGFRCPENLMESEILGFEIQNTNQRKAAWLAQLVERRSAERPRSRVQTPARPTLRVFK